MCGYIRSRDALAPLQHNGPSKSGHDTVFGIRRRKIGRDRKVDVTTDFISRSPRRTTLLWSISNEHEPPQTRLGTTELGTRYQWYALCSRT